MLLEHADLVRECLQIATYVIPKVSVFRHDAKCQLLSTPTDKNRRSGLLDRFGIDPGAEELVILAIEMNRFLGLESLGQGHRFVQSPNPFAWRR